MAARTASQLAWRRRFERGIALAAPLLDVALFAADRLSRLASRAEHDPEPRATTVSPPRGRLR